MPWNRHQVQLQSEYLCYWWKNVATMKKNILSWKWENTFAEKWLVELIQEMEVAMVTA